MTCIVVRQNQWTQHQIIRLFCNPLQVSMFFVTQDKSNFKLFNLKTNQGQKQEENTQDYEHAI